jgi:hypothetical protein
MTSLIFLFLAIAILLALLWAGWVLVRKISELSARWQWGIAGCFLLMILLGVVQILTGYTVALPMAPVLTPVLAFVAYILGIFLLCHKSRIAAATGIIIPAVLLLSTLVRLGRGLVVVLVVILAMGGFVPIAYGRISPRLSYQIVERRGLINDTPMDEFTIYRNPRWFPLMQKRVARGRLPCGPGDAISPDPTEQSVKITCDSTKQGFPPLVVPLR